MTGARHRRRRALAARPAIARVMWAGSARTDSAHIRSTRTSPNDPWFGGTPTDTRHTMTTDNLLLLLPKYHQIKETLRSELPQLYPESRLPPVRTLRDRFGVSQATLDRAL